MDAAQLVIVPDPEIDSGFKIVITDESLLEKRVAPPMEPRFRQLDQKPLEFRTESRPGKRNLYIQCLMAPLRRRRFQNTGWQNVQKKIPMGRIWGTPGKWMRKDLNRALPTEVGDIARDEDLEDVVEANPSPLDHLH